VCVYEKEWKQLPVSKETGSLLMFTTKQDPGVSRPAVVQQDDRVLSWRLGAGVPLPHRLAASLCTAWAAMLYSRDRATNMEINTMQTRA